MKLSLSLSSFLYTLLRTTGYFVYQPILVDNLSDNNGIPSIPTIVSYHLFIKITFIYQLPTANCRLPTAKLPNCQTTKLPYFPTSIPQIIHIHIITYFAVCIGTFSECHATNTLPQDPYLHHPTLPLENQFYLINLKL